jgi:hypothetical protein
VSVLLNHRVSCSNESIMRRTILSIRSYVSFLKLIGGLGGYFVLVSALNIGGKI